MASTVRILFYVLSVDFVSLCAVVGSLLLFFFQFTTRTRLLRDRRRRDGSSGATIHPRRCASFTFEAISTSPSPTSVRLRTSARPMARPAHPEFSVVAITDMTVHARLFCLACQTDSHETLDTLRAAYTSQQECEFCCFRNTRTNAYAPTSANTIWQVRLGSKVAARSINVFSVLLDSHEPSSA
jgi:hypothetical protein